MNIDNLNKLIAHMEAMPDKAFRLDVWVTGRAPNGGSPLRSTESACSVVRGQLQENFCGTAACIAGTAHLLAAAGNESVLSRGSRGVGADWLGLGPDAARELFAPGLREALNMDWDSGAVDLYRVPKEAAVKVLKNLRDTGAVDWNAAYPDSKGVPLNNPERPANFIPISADE